MSTNPTDGDLVAAHLGGDRAALGAIYDRYGASLYDTAAAMLRDRDEAADAVQETFLVAAQKLGQLRDPERLKPWLFAVLRNDVYRRTKRRGRAAPTDFAAPGTVEMAAATDPFADAGGVERDELAALVRAAASGLDARDQLIMELSLRQDLAGEDLGAAVGVTTAQAHVLVHRMRDRLLRSLGALTVARMGRDDCPELASLLDGWDGTFSVLVRKRVARHVDRCEVCDETRSRLPAGALFAAAPVLAAPADLRDAVLTAASSGRRPAHDAAFDASGFPADRGRGRTAVLAPVAAVLLLVVAAVSIGVGLASQDDRALSTTSETEATSTTAVAVETVVTDPASSLVSPPTTVTPSTLPPTTPPPTPGSVELSTALVDLGATGRTGTVTLSNPGAAAVRWSLRPISTAPFTWDVTDGELAGGGARTITVALDRSDLSEGPLAATFTVSGAGTTNPLQVRARVERPPSITDVRHSTTVACRPSSADLVLATVTDDSAVTSVVLEWSGPGGDGSASMLHLGDGDYEGSLDPERVNGEWTLRVVATDARDNTSTVSRPFVISGCGGGGGGGAGGGGGFTT